MNHQFQVVGLDHQDFSSFFMMSDEELHSHNAYFIYADANPGFPCRVSLVEANKNERVLVINYLHHNVDSPYRASGPIFVRENAEQYRPLKNQIPEVLKQRHLSVRGYNSDGNMVSAATCQGDKIESTIAEMFDNLLIEYLHVHNANPGCYACKIIRN